MTVSISRFFIKLDMPPWSGATMKAQVMFMSRHIATLRTVLSVTYSLLKYDLALISSIRL